jgi:hypothetical protein
VQPLSQQELRALLDVLDMHIEGMNDAKERMIEDTTTFTDLDTFSASLQDHDLDVQVIESIRQKVLDDINIDTT